MKNVSRFFFQLVPTFWESVALIGPLGFLYDEIISVDIDFSTSLQLPAGRGLSPQFLHCCYSASELTEMTNHWPLYLSVCLCLKPTPSQFKPKGQQRDLPSLDKGAQLYLDYYRIFFWKSPDLHLHSALRSNQGHLKVLYWKPHSILLLPPDFSDGPESKRGNPSDHKLHSGPHLCI